MTASLKTDVMNAWLNRRGDCFTEARCFDTFCGMSGLTDLSPHPSPTEGTRRKVRIHRFRGPRMANY